jgi:hypothetical protein
MAAVFPKFPAPVRQFGYGVAMHVYDLHVLS